MEFTEPSVTLRAAKDTLCRVLGHWMPSHCARAKSKLREMLNLPSAGSRSTEDIENVSNGYPVKVETAAGVVVAKLQAYANTTVLDLKTALMKVAPQFHTARVQLFVSGHEKHGVLADQAVLVDAVATILGSETPHPGGSDSNVGSSESQHDCDDHKLQHEQQHSQGEPQSSSSLTDDLPVNESVVPISSSARSLLKRGDGICLSLAVVVLRWQAPRLFGSPVTGLLSCETSVASQVPCMV